MSFDGRSARRARQPRYPRARAAFTSPSAPENRSPVLSFSVSFGRPRIRRKVENPVFMRVLRPSILSGFDSDTLKEKRLASKPGGWLARNRKTLPWGSMLRRIHG